MSPGLAIISSVLLLLGNAFFVGAEFALVSARRTQIELAVRNGTPGARLTLRAMEHVSMMMAGAQLGITMCSLGLGALGEPAVAHLLEPVFELVRVPDALVHPISFVVAMSIVVYLHMVVGEMVPKNMAIAGPERAALLLGPPMYWVGLLLRPLLWLMNQIANLTLRLIKVTPQDEVSSTVTADEIQDYVAESHDEGLIDDNEHQLMSGAVQLSEQTAASVLVDVDHLVVLGPDPTVREARQACIDHGFSRFPIVDRDRAWVGYVHVKALLDDEDHLDRPVPETDISPLTRVPRTASLLEVLTTMQQENVHLALVTDDDRVCGAAMLEDVVEMMIGTVHDAGQSELDHV